MISREYVDAYRRRRYFLAAAEVAHEFGRQGLTVTTLCQIGHSARNTFYENFRSIEDCLAQATEYAYEQIINPIDESPRDQDWMSSLEQVIESFYRRIGEEPGLAELLLVHSFSLKGDDVGSSVGKVVTWLKELFEPGRAIGERTGVRAPMIAEELAARSIVVVAQRALLGDRAVRLPDQARPMALLGAGQLVGFAEADRMIA
jgi:AcrR family transcriptional regulator